MRSSWLGVWGACACLLGCGNSPAQDFFDSADAAQVMTAAGSSGTVTVSAGKCSPALDISGGSSGPFNTTDAVCKRVTGAITGWGCSNFDGRSVKVNGVAVTCGQVPLPDPIEGSYYFEVSGGMFAYASFYWF